MKRAFNVCSIFLLAAVAAMLLSGCSTFISAHSQKKGMMKMYGGGYYSRAYTEAADYMKSRQDTGDELMWLMECGMITFAQERYKESLDYFNRAEAVAEDYENRATINLRGAMSEVGAAYTNQNVLPYEGDFFEKILINYYKALNYYALGEPEAAGVELRRVRYRQKNAERDFQEDVYKVTSENYSTVGSQLSGNEIMSNDRVVSDKSALAVKCNNKLGLYLNPAVSFLSAAVYLRDNNYNEALVDYRKLYFVDDGNPFFRRGLVTCAREIGSNPPEELAKEAPYDFKLAEDSVFIIFENGLAPAREERLVELILPPPVGYIGFAYPVLKFFPDKIKNVKFYGSGNLEIGDTMKFSDMEQIIANDLSNDMPIILQRALISIMVKEATSISLQIAAQQIPHVGDAARLMVFIGASIAKKAVNRADTRCWETLPQEYQCSLFKRPNDGIVKVCLIGDDGNVIDNATLNLGSRPGLKLILLKSNGFGSFNLKLFEM
ncbi:MAG TPA: hypothetical protein DCZ94_11330 [Lentisphaeria bacterium]|nr:MAG: hypothetical protein A2X48_17430 [Lentisphaerae bacterium GWF2_49_21]HBC87538.1 hypothetical protein [Lentisphaeria bacterium]